MKSAASAIVTASLAVSASSVWSQTSVIQQNNVTVNREGASVTVSGQTVTVQTSTGVGHIVGDGQSGSETRPIGPVSAISADGAFAVTIKTGSPSGLTIETDKNLLPIVKTDVSNGTLEIYTDQSYSADRRIKVTVTSPEVGDISASGSNEINADGLSGEKLTISLNGSNHVEMTGNVSTMTVKMSGSNHLLARQLIANTASVTDSGSGNATVDAREQIVAEISGAGSISVYGNPKQRNTQVNGAGTITFVQ